MPFLANIDPACGYIEVTYHRDWPWSQLKKGSSKLLLVIHLKITNHNNNIIQESSTCVFVTENVRIF